MKQKKTLLIITVVIASVLGLLAVVLVGYMSVSNHKAADSNSLKQPTKPAQTPPASSISLEGTMVCLQHNHPGDIQTLECAAGLKTDDGKQYALTGQSNKLTDATGSDRRVRISGTLRQDPDSIYKIEGTITVTSYTFI